MSLSLERRLSIALAGVVLAAGLTASLVSFHFSYTEAQEFQDEMLRQVATLALSSPTGNIEPVGDEDSRILVLRPDQQRPAWLPANLKPGFHTLNTADDSMRVYVRHARDGRQVAIAQETDLRDEIALHSALRTLLPTLALIPLLLWLGRSIVRRVFRPVRELAQTVDSQSAEMPQTLPHEEVPEASGFSAGALP